MKKTYRCILYGLSIICLLSISYILEGNLQTILSQFWFSSGILLLILLSLIDQPFFSKDANVFVNAVTASVSLLLVPAKDHTWIFWTFLGLVGYLLSSSYILFWVRKNPLNEENKVVQFFSRINRILGCPEVLFSAFFLWGAINQFGLFSYEIIPLFWFWLIFLLLNVPGIAKIICDLITKKQEVASNKAVGKIFGIQSKEIFLVKLFNSKKRLGVSQFDIVEFKYSFKSDRIFRGFVIDYYWLDEEQWIKVLSNKDIENTLKKVPNYQCLNEDTVYKLDVKDKNIYIDKFVGTVTENSKIDKIKFVFNSKNVIQAGQLLEVSINDNKVLYQLLEGLTRIETLEAKNESGEIIGEAIQLGVWNEGKTQFDKFGWVPEINTPVLLISETKEQNIPEDFIKVGEIPGTKFPVLMDMNIAINHHMAVLGVTGTGKSVFVRDLVKKYASTRKVFIVDFTGEHKKKLQDQNLTPFIDKNTERQIYDNFKSINTEMDKFPNQRNQSTIDTSRNFIVNTMKSKINDFIISTTEHIKIIELPDVENSQNIFEFTRAFFKELFNIAKEKLGDSTFSQICVVLEEAHTIIPEWNFVSDNSKGCQAAINAISQIALQGRKYNVGLLVVAQRTANVSKTVLSQCNSIIAFQEFDNTSIDFLANYYGDDIAKVLPSLKFRQAIAVGKAFKSTIPLIFEVPEINEDKNLQEGVNKHE